MFPVFLDTCVLLRPYLCDTLLSVAEAGVYRPLWSPMVMTELERNLARRGLNQKQIAHRLDQMNGAFPDALVVGYEALISKMTNDPKDRHVLAAAVRGGAEVLVTENIRDFPATAVRLYNIKVVSQDAFLLDALDLQPAGVLAALRRQASRYHREPRTIESLLAILGGAASGCPRFKHACDQVLCLRCSKRWPHREVPLTWRPPSQTVVIRSGSASREISSSGFPSTVMRSAS
jgi:predicted nucleic acid-binding protein